jgi:hypothetical protein
MSQHRRIAGRFQGDQLNKVGEDLGEGEVLGRDIPIEPEYKASKEVLISFSAAVAKENNRGSITAAQRRGRATPQPQPRLRSESESSPDLGGELDNALAAATNAVSTVASALASSPPVRQVEQTPARRVIAQKQLQLPAMPRRRLFLPESSPIRQPDPEPAPVRKPVKQTRKRKAAEDVDMGPRKLRKRK